MSVGHTSPTELFEPYFDEDLIKLLINESILYAQQSNRYDFSYTVPEMKSFIGFPLFTGYHQLTLEEMFWSLDRDCNTMLMRQALTRKRYRDIKRNHHFHDHNNLDATDKLVKVRQHTNLLNAKYQQFGVFRHNLSID